MQTKTKKAHPKKVLRASLTEKLQPVLHDIKESFVVNEKKLEKLVKKAAKFLADGLHISPSKPKKSLVKKKSSAKKVAGKVKAKQVTINKAAVKKPLTPKKSAKKAAKKK